MQYLQKGIQQEQPKEASEVKHVMADSHMQKDHQHIMHTYVEFGTRFMDAQPFVRPAFKQQVPIFKSDMKKLVK